jgi:hypothetical protein
MLRLSLMSTDHILALLIAERDRLNRAIEALQGPVKRRGRPPKSALATISLSSPEPAQPPKRKHRTFTAAQRKQQAARMKVFWAAKKKAAVNPKSKAGSKPKKAAQAE